MIGSLSYTDESVLRRQSFIFCILCFVSATDLVSALQGSNLTAPLPVIILGLISLSLLYYGSKKELSNTEKFEIRDREVHQE